MKTPSASLVVDAAVLVAVVRGRSSGAILEAQKVATLITTDRVVQEARRRLEFGLQRPELLDLLDALLEQITIIPVAALETLLPESEAALRDAIAGRNGAMRDAHMLALARAVDADIWTADREFAGTGVATWSTPNLLRSLAHAEAERG
ncbi:MAG TPA: PIN domain-containing protein [Rhizomicrobium sp.]|jgi:predicted nucleic acid-binding protein